MKKGYSFIEIVISAAIISILVLASIPFFNQVSVKTAKNLDNSAAITEELSDINYSLGCNTFIELLNSKTDNIEITSVEGIARLYKVEGIKTGAYGYIIVKGG